MREYSLRVDWTADGALGVWLDDHSAGARSRYATSLSVMVDTPGSEFYQAVMRCILQIRARGDRVLYIDLPERVQNMDRCLISL